KEEEEEEEIPIQAGRFKSKDYMDRYINPPEYLERERKRLEKEREKHKIPPEPQRDVLLFLLEHAPLKNWQADILSIVREESYYFVPQKQTKVMNEGWGSYWHAKMMTEGLLEPEEVIDYADHHSNIMGIMPGRVNPYKLGLALFRDIEERWDKGRFGKEYEECQDIEERRRWDKQLGLGRQKIFEVRRIYNDVSFIDEFLTKEFCREQKLFVFAERDMGAEKWYEIVSREFEQIKKTLLFSLTNFGRPIIRVADGNYRNRGELYLTHQHEGVDMDLNYARATLINLYTIWGRPVHVETVIKGQRMLLSYEGDVHRERRIRGRTD
ncbi:MAG TPA: SpoVR family protein, partial [Anaerolineae bacterium]|nr:SpoVR family protein [Anaerolineae bacterium]